MGVEGLRDKKRLFSNFLQGDVCQLGFHLNFRLFGCIFLVNFHCIRDETISVFNVASV